MTIQELTQKRDELARSLQQQEVAGESLAAARKRYDQKVTAALEALKQQLEKQNQEITDTLNAATKAKLEADNAVREQRDTLKNELLPRYFGNNMDDKKPVAGIARRDSITIESEDDDYRLIGELAEEAPYLLQINKSALQRFVRAMATETRIGGAYPAFPEPMASMLPNLSKSLVFDRQWTISDKTIIKHTPADETTVTATEEE